jgi:hypothetical protein
MSGTRIEHTGTRCICRVKKSPSELKTIRQRQQRTYWKVTLVPVCQVV